MALTDDQRREVDERCELFVARVLPDVIRASISAHNNDGRAHEKTVSTAVRMHDEDVDAHDGTPRRVSRLVWVTLGVCFGAGIGGGVGLAKLLTLLA